MSKASSVASEASGTARAAAVIANGGVRALSKARETSAIAAWAATAIAKGVAFASKASSAASKRSAPVA